MRTLIALMVAATMAIAGDVTLWWDGDSSATKYTIYELPTTGPKIKVLDTTGVPGTIINATPTMHVYAVSASNVSGESAMSPSIAVDLRPTPTPTPTPTPIPIPSPPKNLRTTSGTSPTPTPIPTP
jgi:hypothetical protein